MTVELRSDTFTMPTPAMREAMVTAPLGDDVYGEDPTVHALEERAAELLGMAAACLMPSGTMANLAALTAHAPRGSRVFAGRESDIYVYEAHGVSVCSGVALDPIDAPGGVPDLMYALTIATGLLGMALNSIMVRVERRVLHWHPSYREAVR